jgi:hypothetical protein
MKALDEYEAATNGKPTVETLCGPFRPPSKKTKR